MDYWKNYWGNIKLDGTPQEQVRRTIHGKEISEDLWHKTVRYICKKVDLDEDAVVLDLCSGNGMLAIPISFLCKSVLCVDISKSFLESIKKNGRENVETYQADASTFSIDRKFSHVFWYCSIQHFSEVEVLDIFSNVHEMLQDGGVFYIGDIPDREKLWTFANTRQYEKEYFDSLREGNPKIGTWFMKQELLRMAEYIDFSHYEILEQPLWMFNSRYRFDMVLYK